VFNICCVFALFFFVLCDASFSGLSIFIRLFTCGILEITLNIWTRHYTHKIILKDLKLTGSPGGPWNPAGPIGPGCPGGPFSPSCPLLPGGPGGP
jgi:hypothetical protein